MGSSKSKRSTKSVAGVLVFGGGIGSPLADNFGGSIFLIGTEGILGLMEAPGFWTLPPLELSMMSDSGMDSLMGTVLWERGCWGASGFLFLGTGERKRTG